jgi:hypothetical protein
MGLGVSRGGQIELMTTEGTPKKHGLCAISGVFWILGYLRRLYQLNIANPKIQNLKYSKI